MRRIFAFCDLICSNRDGNVRVQTIRCLYAKKHMHSTAQTFNNAYSIHKDDVGKNNQK